MNTNLKIVAFAGSLRRNSFNKQILKIVTDKINESGVTLTVLDLNDYDIPLYNQDVEETTGMPENVQQFKAEIHNANAIIIATPEYNGSIPGVLKNAIDWASRPLTPDEGTYASFSKKPVGLIAASPGYFGGIRSIIHTRSILMNLGCAIMPSQVAVPSASTLKEANIQQLEKFAVEFIEFAGKLV